MKHNNLGARRKGDGGGGTSDGGSNARAESAVFLSSDMENASGSMAPSIYAHGSKVNNTNIHIEHSHHSSRHKDSKAQNPNILTDSGGDDAGVDGHGFPLERLVIGAEETSTSAPLNNDGTPRGPSSNSGSFPSDRRINSVDEIPEEATLLTTELSEMGGDMQHMKDKGECNLQCGSDSLCDRLPVHRTDSITLTTSYSLENYKSEGQLENIDRNDSPDENKAAVVQNSNCSDTRSYLSTENMESEQKLHDHNSSASSCSEVKSVLVKHVHNSLHGKSPKHSEKDRSCSGVDNSVETGKTCVKSQKPEVLLKGKKLSLLSRKLNGYSCEEGLDVDDVPTLNKKETSV
jgi:hypothetical protein